MRKLHYNLSYFFIIFKINNRINILFEVDENFNYYPTYLLINFVY